MPQHVACGKGLSGIGLLMMGDADGTVGMVCSVIMVMKCGHHGGKEQEAGKVD